MTRADQETTARIDRSQLCGLLDTMSPVDQQPITARTSITDIEAELAKQRAMEAEAATPPANKQGLFGGVNWNEILDAAAGATGELELEAVQDRKTAAAKAAALLPRVSAPRGTPTTPIPRIKRQTAQTVARTTAERKATQTVSDAIARLDADVLAERVAFPALSPQVVSNLSNEEIAMLPMELRLMLPEVPAHASHPRVQLTPVPSEQSISIRSVPCVRRGHSIRVEASEAPPRRATTIVASCAATLLVAAVGMYVVL